ncbi:hypothetical protein MJO29_004292 [Puccinia striiformis f. sp. tritici]|nr:hypothetical protein MJO29_004292 [Puccinia striiformis f. sp. tritici]
MGKMGETDSSQPKENQVPPSINVRPDAPPKYHQLTHLLYPSPHPKTTSPHNPRSDSNLSYNLKYCHSSHLNRSCVKKKTEHLKSRRKPASRKRSRLTTEDDEEAEEDSNHRDGRPNEEIEEEENIHTNFTLENFESQLPFWSIQKLRDVLAKRKKACSNRVPPNVQEALVLLQQKYTKSKLMLSLLGRVSENTTSKFLGENKPSRKKSDWNRFVAFSLISGQTPVPPKGCSEGWEEHNVILGEAYDDLSKVEKEVFGPKIFQFFSKIPCYFEDPEGEDDGDKTVKLTHKEDDCYQPLYKKLVNKEKIKFVLSQGTVTHNKTSNAFKKASSHFRRLNSELFTIANLYNSTYYILTSSRAPGVNSFCHEYSNDVGWLAITKSKWASKETFEAYSQAREIQEVLEKATGVSIVKKVRATDALKGKLQAALNRTLAEACGTPVEGTTFPKTKDPASKLGLGLQIVQSEQSKLSADLLVKEYEAMNTDKTRKWLEDIESGAFKIQLMD